MNRSKIWIVSCAVLLAGSWVAAGSAFAAAKPTGQQPATTEQPTTTTTEVIPAAEPAKVKELAEQAGVTTEKVSAMRTSGLGWGEVKIAISLAQKISTADTTAGSAALPISPILDSLLAQRQSGMGWGEIAKANGFKLGEVVGKGAAKKELTIVPIEPTTTESVTTTGTKPERGSKLDKADKLEKPVKMDKVERPEKPEKPERPAKPEKPEKPERPEKPQHAAK